MWQDFLRKMEFAIRQILLELCIQRTLFHSEHEIIPRNDSVPNAPSPVPYRVP